MTTHRTFEFTDDDPDAVAAIDAIAGGRGWCNLTPEVRADDVEVLAPSVFALRTRRGAPVATFVTAPPRRGVARPSSLGVLHTRGRLGAERVASLAGSAPLALRQDHQQRGLLFEVPPDATGGVVLPVMRRFLESLCDYDRTGKWRLEVYERAEGT